MGVDVVLKLTGINLRQNKENDLGVQPFRKNYCAKDRTPALMLYFCLPPSERNIKLVKLLPAPC